MSDRSATIAGALERATASKRLTVAQGRVLASEYVRFTDQVGMLQLVRDNLRSDVEVERDWHGKRVTEWNVLMHILDAALNVRMWGDEKDRWHVIDLATSREIACCQSIPEAFGEALRVRLTEKNDNIVIIEK